MNYTYPKALVATDWLAEHLDDPDLRILDASFTLPGMSPTGPEQYARAHIPGAVFFDIDAIRDKANPLPHMLPDEKSFAATMSALGIGTDHRIIVYDSGAVISAPRAWWTLRVFGHTKVAVLNGGMAKWLAEQRPVTTDVPKLPPARFEARLDKSRIRNKAEMLANLSAKREQVIDARSAARFAGTAPEPREGLRGGHIPGSLSLPLDQLVDKASKTFLPADEMATKFRDAGLDAEKPVITTCGSGVTAAGLAFGLYLLGWPNAAVYDGSWSEWGLPGDTPVATGPA